MRNKQDVMKMFEMRLDGKSIEEIGRHFGCTKQNVYLILSRRINNVSCEKRLSKCVFPGIVNWINEKGTTLYKLNDSINCMCQNSFYNKMHGKNAFTLPEIKAILAYTGLTFEEAFGEEIKPTDNG